MGKKKKPTAAEVFKMFKSLSSAEQREFVNLCLSEYGNAVAGRFLYCISHAVGQQPRPPRNPGHTSLRPIVRRLYIDDELSDGQIARNLEVLAARDNKPWSRGGVYQFRKRWGIRR